ncbi:MAG: bifunctional phosphopantothenoylcysteine decarboxylase/phosphopantothenate--cysteine ligase CoaBC [bacterium]|nr:bifunctional phosphopantothenoylcysteine decarboxylase/phosphopantothenate--cysteine ligase CoaBC [bacterium]
MLQEKKIILGITGGIAAYKSAFLISQLKKLGADIWVVMTKAATSFITPLTLQTLSKNKVYIDLFEDSSSFIPKHISLNENTDLILIAPATANTISKISQGIADNLLTTLVLSSKTQKVLAPTMNENMYNNPIFQENMEKLKKMGYLFIEPEYGRLACNKEGKGRMANIDKIIEEVKQVLINDNLPLKNRKILITAGATREPIDIIRYISNRSSGKMGYALAKEAKRLGGEVTLISGPTFLSSLEGVAMIKVDTALKMKEAVTREYNDKDIIIFSAAVCDFRPKKVYKGKIKKREENLSLELIENPDILRELGSEKKGKFLVGFAAEDSDNIKSAIIKLREKNLDLIVFNNITEVGAGFEVDTNKIKIITKDETIKEFPLLTKQEVAQNIFKEIIKNLPSAN